MAATIRFPDGTEATLTDREGTWVCAHEDALPYLSFYTDTVLERGAFFPDPIGDLAEEVAKLAEAKVIHKDPWKGWPSNPGPTDGSLV